MPVCATNSKPYLCSGVSFFTGQANFSSTKIPKHELFAQTALFVLDRKYELSPLFSLLSLRRLAARPFFFPALHRHFTTTRHGSGKMAVGLIRH